MQRALVALHNEFRLYESGANLAPASDPMAKTLV
jgi:hypothetical protein